MGPSCPNRIEGDSFAFSDEVMDKCDVFLTLVASLARGQVGNCYSIKKKGDRETLRG